MAQFDEVMQWVDSHINYERSGPGQSVGPADQHDPDARLRRLRDFLDLMDNPQQAFPSIHVTGTNGKTSTARMVTALLEAQGLNTGTYTSPHLQRVNERIVTNGEPISDDDLVEVFTALRLLEPMMQDKLSFFELFTAAAFRFFAERPVDAGVIEVGVGGQWDATNVVDGAVSVITNVGLDHLNYLGPTRMHIAEQKAGIIKPDSAVVLGETDPQIVSIFLERAHRRAYQIDQDFGLDKNLVAIGGRLLDLRTPGGRYEDIFLSLHGSHQGANAAVALMAVEAFFEKPLADDVVREAFASVTSPGRMEIINRQPLCLIDGAHNGDGARALVQSLDEEFGDASGRILVVGMLSPHEPVEILTELRADKARMVIACVPDWPRAVPAEDIAEAARSLGAAAVVIPDVAKAVEEALAMATEDEIVLVTGSLYVVGAARQARLRQDDVARLLP